MDRREYLLAGTSLGASALAGCSFLASASTRPPEVPSQRLEDGGWTQTNETTATPFEKAYGPVTVTAVSHTLQYTDQALQQQVSDRTLGELTTALSVFFATRVDFSPNIDNLPAGAGREEIMAEIKANSLTQFKRQMENQGLEEIEETGEGTLDIDTGETAETTELSAVYPFEGITFDVTDEESVEIPSSKIDVSGFLALWHHGDFVLVSGGAYPAQNFAKTVEDELSNGISVSVDIDLGLDPEQYRNEIRSLVAGVQ